MLQRFMYEGYKKGSGFKVEKGWTVMIILK